MEQDETTTKGPGKNWRGEGRSLAGKKGGETLLERRGKDWFREIGSRGGKTTASKPGFLEALRKKREAARRKREEEEE